MTFDEFYFKALNYAGDNPAQRMGQALVNYLRCDPPIGIGRKDIYEAYFIDALENNHDAFNNDEFVPDFLEFAEANW